MAATKKTKAKPETGFEAMPGMNTEAFKEGFEKISASFEQFAELNKESLETCVEASKKVAGNVEQLTSEHAEFAKSSFEEGFKAAQSIAACKSPQEALDLNTQYFKSAFDNNMAQFNKMSEAIASNSKEVFEPMSDSYNKFIETVQAYRP